MELTLNIKELRERWMKLYLNIHMLKSHNPKATKLLEDFKMKMSEFNEDVMKFFDEMEKPI